MNRFEMTRLEITRLVSIWLDITRFEITRLEITLAEDNSSGSAALSGLLRRDPNIATCLRIRRPRTWRGSSTDCEYGEAAPSAVARCASVRAAEVRRLSPLTTEQPDLDRLTGPVGNPVCSNASESS
jgi:hypothetical protein